MVRSRPLLAKHISTSLPAVVLWLLTGAASVAQEKETFTPRHVARLRTVTAAEVAPDGKQIAYLLSVPRDLSKDKDGPSWAGVHVVDAAGASRPFVTGQTDVSQVKWAPDGKYISFLDKRDKDKHRALYRIAVSGGEARKVLEHGTDIKSYSWGPDGRRVAFLAEEPRPESEEKLRDKGFNQEVYEEDWRPVKVWVAAVEGKEKPKALDLPGSASELHWAPAGDRLAVALAPTPLIDDEYMFRKVRVVDARTGEVLQPLDIPGKMGQLAWSPDGQFLALIAGEDKYDPREGRLWVASRRSNVWQDVLPGYAGHVSAIAWSDRQTVAFIGDEGVRTTLATVKVHWDEKNSRIEPREKKDLLSPAVPVLTSLSVSEDGQSFALVGNTPEHPGEVYLLAKGGADLRRLTDSNPWLRDMHFAHQEVVTHTARDGLKLQGILVRPLDEKKGKRYPLVLTVHGGPEAHVANGWVTSYANLGQVGAAKGLAVFYPNYRGSTGRGVEFSRLGQKDAAGKEFEDLVDAVDHLIQTGLVDRDRVGITGGSYGGYATAWCSTFYSDRFAAGVMFVGISDAISKVGTTDIPYEQYLSHHHKWLWEDWDYFLKRSPIYHVQKAHTPLLILHGKSDPRVHPGQSMELCRHLKVLNKAPVRLVFYSGEGHGNRRAASRLDYNLRLLRWMEHYLKGPGGSPPPREIDYGLDREEEK